jgi:hypothetical protein
LILEEVQENSDGELFWIVQNGIKMTGMPAFGNTHDGAQIAAIVLFLRRLPSFAPEEYAARIEALGLATGKHDGHHPGATGTGEQDAEPHGLDEHHQ